MKRHRIASNQTEQRFGNVTVCYSYWTPVAIHANGTTFFTEHYYSPTTSQHLNKAKLRYGGLLREITQAKLNDKVAKLKNRATK